MFCVIQEVEVKTVPAGEPKGFVVDETKVTWDGGVYIKYSYHYASERFERPIRKSYRISVHESYRENGKVKKKQTVICTVGYYDIVDWGGWIGDFIIGGLKAKAEILGLTEDVLYEFGSLLLTGYLQSCERAAVTFCQGRYKSRIKKLAAERPEECEILAENQDGSWCAHIPVTWVKINPTKQLSEEQRREIAERFKRR